MHPGRLYCTYQLHVADQFLVRHQSAIQFSAQLLFGNPAYAFLLRHVKFDGRLSDFWHYQSWPGKVGFNALEFFPNHPDEMGLWPRGVLPGLAGGG